MTGSVHACLTPTGISLPAASGPAEGPREQRQTPPVGLVTDRLKNRLGQAEETSVRPRT